ncbi:MAG: type VI secretion system baseplate subunit TssE [Panacagrimonas sp.]
MATLTTQEKLQPALLDRLIDDAADKKVEARDARLITGRKLREAVLRDLAWLFNAVRPSDEIDPEQLPHAYRSVLNYGLPALSGTTASSMNSTDLESRLHEAILAFEPRIIPDTLKVEAVLSENVLDHHNQIQVQIRGKLWAQPVPLEILLRTAVDLETNQTSIQDVTG